MTLAKILVLKERLDRERKASTTRDPRDRRNRTGGHRSVRPPFHHKRPYNGSTGDMWYWHTLDKVTTIYKKLFGKDGRPR